MRSFRPVFVLGIAALLLLAVLIPNYQAARGERNRIEVRYQQMRMALSSGNTNLAQSLFAPDLRGGAYRNFDMLDRFARPLSRRSGIRVSGPHAVVCPERLFHYGFIPGGHTVEMVKVDGEWFFTGSVHID